MTSFSERPITAVRTTGIFCREGCPARPLHQNVVRYATVQEALLAGYRPCLRCRPTEPMRPPLPDIEATHE